MVSRGDQVRDQGVVPLTEVLYRKELKEEKGQNENKRDDHKKDPSGEFYWWRELKNLTADEDPFGFGSICKLKPYPYYYFYTNREWFMVRIKIHTVVGHPLHDKSGITYLLSWLRVSLISLWF